MSKQNGKREKLVEIYRASGEAEAQFIKSLLEDNGVPCLLKSHAAPSVHVIAVDGMAETRVMVWESMAGKARQLIEGKDYA